jgi:acyl-coenzyme A synthetase/AMP-(fatty) acid ligase
MKGKSVTQEIYTAISQHLAVAKEVVVGWQEEYFRIPTN